MHYNYLIALTIIATATTIECRKYNNILQNEDPRGGKVLFKTQRTTTFTDLFLFTSIIPYTCFSFLAALPACTGRRRRSNRLTLALESNTQSVPPDLEGTIANDELPRLFPPGDNAERDAKFIFTLWRKSSTTTTITVFSTNRSITVSISAYCTAPNVSINAC